MPALAPPDDRRQRRDETVMRLYMATERLGRLSVLYAAYDAGLADGAEIADSAARRAVRDAGERGKSDGA